MHADRQRETDNQMDERIDLEKQMYRRSNRQADLQRGGG